MDSLLIFTNRGRVYQVKVHELPDAGRTAKGVPIVNVINMQPDESVTTLLAVRTFEDAKYLFFTTRLGKVKRTSLDQFKAVRSSGLIAIGIDEEDELAWVRVTSGSDEVILVSEHGQAIKFNETDARAMGRPAAGVMGIRLAPRDRVIAFEVVDEEDDLLVVSQRGLGKRTAIALFRGQGRGGKGIQAMKLTPKTGLIVAAGMVRNEDNVLLMNTKGVVIRIAAGQISKLGRSTQGVTLMRLADDEQVATMTISRAKEGDATLNGITPDMISPGDGKE
jgi:DNA gyrase subunit A